MTRNRGDQMSINGFIDNGVTYKYDYNALDNIPSGPPDGSVTTNKLSAHAVTMGKTDFYYTQSAEYSPSWLTLTGGNGALVAGSVAHADLATALSEMPDTITIVAEDVAEYWSSGAFLIFRARNSSYIVTDYACDKTIQTITIGETRYGIFSWTKEDFQEAYETYLEDIAGGLIGTGFYFQLGNVNNRFNGDAVSISGEATSELIEANYLRTVVSEDFAEAVNYVLDTGLDTMTHNETVAKYRLSGKVMVALGDSYTNGMNALLSAVAAKYEMAFDNRGVVSSTIAGLTDGIVGWNPMWYRAGTIVSDYTSGKIIDGTTYTKDDVAIITFMGGANDGFGVNTWLGTGMHETATTTIYGACHHIFSTLLENFPKAKMICITQPPNYKREVSDVTDDATAQALGFDNLAELQVLSDVQYSNYSMAVKESIVREMAIAYGVPLVDMFHDFPSMFNPSNRSTYWSSDKLHLTEDGYSIISAAIDKKIVEIVAG